MPEPVWYRKAPVPDWDTGFPIVDAGGIDLNANTQLWLNDNFKKLLPRRKDGPAHRWSPSSWAQNLMPEPVRYRKAETETEIQDAGGIDLDAEAQLWVKRSF